MGNFLSIQTILIFLACLILGGGYAWFLYKSNKNLSKRIKNTLFIIRAIAVAFILFLLFAPLVKLINYTVQRPIIVFAQDNSLSIGQIEPENFDQKQYEVRIKQLLNTLSEKYDVKTYSFADSISTGLKFDQKGKLTNGVALFNRLYTDHLNKNVGAIIVASDGLFNRGGNPLYELQQIKSPLYTIALGDTIPKRDILIANVNYNNIVYLDNEFDLIAQIQAYESVGETAQLIVSANGIKIKQVPIEVTSNSFVKEIPIKLKANQLGVQKYTLTIASIKNEITARNNTETVFVEIIDGRQKVLIAAASPHPDLGVLKQVIESNKHYEVDLFLNEELSKIDIKKYNLAILYQLPGLSFTANELLSSLQKMKIPQWYIVGAQTNVNLFNQVQKEVFLNKSGNTLQEIFPNVDDKFSQFKIEPNILKSLALFDPLLAPFATVQVNTPYNSLFNQRIGKVNSQYPLWFFTKQDQIKKGYLIGEGLWKWRLEEAKNQIENALLTELIGKTVQYLAVKDDKRKFKVVSSKRNYEDNEPIIINANLYNDAYEAVNTPDVQLELKNATGGVFNYTFNKLENAYQLDLGVLAEGNYTYSAKTNYGGKSYSASGAFIVNAIQTEYQQTTANHQLLYTMAKQNNGKLFLPQQLEELEKELLNNDQIKSVRLEDRRYEELIGLKWLFAFILILLTLEWFLRKRNGEA